MRARTESNSDALLLTKPEARALLGIGKSTLDAILKRGDLPVVRPIGRSVRIPRRAIDEWIERNSGRWEAS